MKLVVFRTTLVCTASLLLLLCTACGSKDQSSTERERPTGKIIVGYEEDNSSSMRLERASLGSSDAVPIAGATNISAVWPLGDGTGVLALQRHKLLHYSFADGTSSIIAELPVREEASVLPSPDGSLATIDRLSCSAPEVAARSVGIYDLRSSIRRLRALPVVAHAAELVEMWAVAFSPDNALLAFAVARYGAECRGINLSGVELHVLDLQTGRHRLIESAPNLLSAAFSPAVKMLAYAIETETGVDIRIADLTTGRRSVVAHRTTEGGEVVWKSPQLLYSLSGAAWAYDPETRRTVELGTVETIEFLGRLPTVAGVSSNGAAVALASLLDPTELTIILTGRAPWKVPLPRPKTRLDEVGGVWVGFD